MSGTSGGGDGEMYKDPLDTDSYASEDYVDEETGAPQVIIEEDNLLADPHRSRLRRKRMLLLGGGLALVVILSIIIVVPSVLLTKKNKNDKEKDDVMMIPVNSSTTTEDEDRTSIAAGTDTTGTAESSLVEEEDIVPLPFPEVKEMTVFSKDILQGYSTPEDLKQDLTRAAQAVVNSIVLSNIRRQDETYQYHHQHDHHEDYYDDYVEEEEAVTVEEEVAAATEEALDPQGKEEEEAPAVAVTAAKAAATQEDQKEKPTEDDKKKKKNDDDEDEEESEPDIVAQDENYMYAAYGDYVMVWDEEGNTIEQLKMPQGERTRYGHAPKSYINALFLTKDHLVVITRRYHDYRDYYYRQRRGRRQLQPPMAVTRPHHGGGSNGREEDRPPVLSPDKTEVRVYKKPQKKDQGRELQDYPPPPPTFTSSSTSSSGGTSSSATMMIDEEKPSTGWNNKLYEMPLVASQILQGHYNYGVLMAESNKLHIVTSSWLQIHFHRELDVYNFPWTTREGYAKEAADLATKTLIPQFVEGVMDALLGKEGDHEGHEVVPNMMRINSWNMEVDSNIHYYDASSVQNYNQISSIDINDIITTAAAEDKDKMLEVKKSSFFGPHVSGVTGKDGNLVLSLSTWQRNHETDQNKESLFLVALKEDAQEDGGGTNFHSIVEMPGSIAHHGRQSTSVDIQGNDIRIATMVQKWYQYDMVWKSCGDIYYFEDRCMSSDNWIDCAETTWSCGARGLEKGGGCPYTSFTCQEGDDEEDEDPSSTENYIVVLDLVEPGEMKERGRVRVGNIHEAISSVYFDESHAFVTTYDTSPEFRYQYEQFQYYQNYMMSGRGNKTTASEASKPPELPPLKKESFYTVDIPTGGQVPSLHNHVEFKEGTRSTSLRPLEVSDDRTLLLSFGRNYTRPDSNGGGPRSKYQDPGRSDWGLITVMDVTDPANPQVVASHMLNNTVGYESFSDAEWDPKTVSLHDGYLVIPLQMYPRYDHHHGYYEDDEPMEHVEANDNVNEQQEEPKEGEEDDEPEDESEVAEDVEKEIEKLERDEEARAEAEVAHAGDVAPTSMIMDRPDHFRGFIVFDVSNVAERGIVEKLRINHVRNKDEKKCRYCEGYFQGSRSYLFNDSTNNKVLATVTDQYFIGTNLETGEELWAFSPSVEGEAMECCW